MVKVAIIGAGSVGLLLGSFLAEAGREVTMLVRREEQAHLLMEQGIERINEDGTKSVFDVKATTDMKELHAYPVWIIAVKFSALSNLLAQMSTHGMNNPLLFVQNGIGHLALALETDLPDLAFATVEHGAFRTDDRTVRHNGVGDLTIGVARGDVGKFSSLDKVRSTAFPVTYHSDVEYVLMRKVLVNCMINPLTAILEIENGELLTNPWCYGLFKQLYAELMDAFPEMRSALSLEDVIAVCRSTARNRSSMLADRSAGRHMEIETIVSAVIEKADSVKKTLPLLTTFEKMLYAIDRKERTP